jgi:hypothetical protein
LAPNSESTRALPRSDVRSHGWRNPATTADNRSGRYFPIAVDRIFNNSAITSADRLGAGALNVWGNSLPANSLPTGEVLVHDIPFLFAGAGVADDNVRCAGQSLALPTGRTDWLHVLAASERRTEDIVWLRYADGACDPEWLRVSDFWPARPRFGELLAFRCGQMHYPHHVQSDMDGQIWLTRVPVVRRVPLASVRLPDNPAIHVFALTLERSR